MRRQPVCDCEGGPSPSRSDSSRALTTRGLLSAPDWPHRTASSFGTCGWPDAAGGGAGTTPAPPWPLDSVKGWIFDEGRIAGRAERHRIPGLQKQVQLADRDFSASGPNEVWVADLWARETRDMRRIAIGEGRVAFPY